MSVERSFAGPEKRSGVVAPLVTVLLPVLVLFLGFSIDLAHMQKSRAELRIATDNAARAAASTLARTDDLGLARQAAREVAAAHSVAGTALSLDDSQIQFGRSTDRGGALGFAAGSRPFNAVRATGLRTNATTDGAVPLYFGSLVGQPGFEPEFTAVAAFTNSDIVLVLDRSTSMKQEADASTSGMYASDPRFADPPWDDSRWGALDTAVRVFTQTMRDTLAEERVSVVTYASDIAGDPIYESVGPYDIMAEATLERSLTDSMDDIDATLNQLKGALWNGDTYIEAGMRLAIDELARGGRITADKKVIVMTDGFQNVGDAEAAARASAAADIQVHTITFGSYSDQDLMREVARLGTRQLSTRRGLGRPGRGVPQPRQQLDEVDRMSSRETRASPTPRRPSSLR